MAAVRQAVDRFLLGDLEPMLVLLAEDITFCVATGGDEPVCLEDSGKQPVVDYFTRLGGLVTFWQMDYTARGDQMIAWAGRASPSRTAIWRVAASSLWYSTCGETGSPGSWWSRTCRLSSVPVDRCTRLPSSQRFNPSAGLPCQPRIPSFPPAAFSTPIRCESHSQGSGTDSGPARSGRPACRPRSSRSPSPRDAGTRR